MSKRSYSAKQGAKKGGKGALINFASAVVLGALTAALAPETWALLVTGLEEAGGAAWLLALLPIVHGLGEAVRNRVQHKD